LSLFSAILCLPRLSLGLVVVVVVLSAEEEDRTNTSGLLLGNEGNNLTIILPSRLEYIFVSNGISIVSISFAIRREEM
jgi:hypothetical protein